MPPARAEESAAATTVIAKPYLAPWVHDLLPLDGGELIGAARITPPGPDGRSPVIAPSGHRDFKGAGTAPLIRLDTRGFGLATDLGVRGLNPAKCESSPL